MICFKYHFPFTQIFLALYVLQGWRGLVEKFKPLSSLISYTKYNILLISIYVFLFATSYMSRLSQILGFQGCIFICSIEEYNKVRNWVGCKLWLACRFHFWNTTCLYVKIILKLIYNVFLFLNARENLYWTGEGAQFYGSLCGWTLRADVFILRSWRPPLIAFIVTGFHCCSSGIPVAECLPRNAVKSKF